MSIIEIKVTLQDIEPAVTRTLQVPADIRLDGLHLTLQVAMGWTNSHLYMFEAARATWGIADPDFGGEGPARQQKPLWAKSSRTPAKRRSTTSTILATTGNTGSRSAGSPIPSLANSIPD